MVRGGAGHSERREIVAPQPASAGSRVPRPDPSRRHFVVAGLLTILGATIHLVPAWGVTPAFTIAREGDAFVINGTLHVPVPVEVAWDVLTDYDHMSGFVIDLQESRVLSSPSDPVLRVYQRGVTRLGPFAFDYEVEREVRLDRPRLIRSRGLRGNVKRLDMETSLEPEGAGVLLRYHAEIVPDFWVPSFLGAPLMRREAEQQFASLVAEMLRRAQALPPDPGRGN